MPAHLEGSKKSRKSGGSQGVWQLSGRAFPSPPWSTPTHQWRCRRHTFSINSRKRKCWWRSPFSARSLLVDNGYSAALIYPSVCVWLCQPSNPQPPSPKNPTPYWHPPHLCHLFSCHCRRIAADSSPLLWSDGAKDSKRGLSPESLVLALSRFDEKSPRN